MSLIRSGIGPRFMVSHPPLHLTKESLLGLSQREQLLCVYKHLFKLRHFLGDTSTQYTSYCNLLRRKFRYSDIHLRRRKFLGLSDVISPDLLALRLANTYAFIFNASCAIHIPSKTVFFYEDMKQQAQERMETNVVKTILRMEHECPAEIKYDRSLKWVEETREFLERAGDSERVTDEMKSFGASKRLNFIGYFQYEHTLMCANETSQMCL